MNRVSSILKSLTSKQWLLILAALVYIPLWFWTIAFSYELVRLGYPPELILPTLGSDSFEYTTLAQNLIDHKWFSMSTSAPYVPEVFRTIGYPLFTAVLVWLSKSFFAVTLVQIVLTYFTGFFIYRMGEKMYSVRVGFIAALIYMFNPNTVFHTLVILSDILFVFLLVAAVYLLFFTEQRTLKKLGVAGLLLGFTTLVRPIAIYSLFIIIPLYVWSYLKTFTRNEWIKALAIFFIGYTVLVAPWMIRNKVKTGVLGLSTVTAVNLYRYNVPDFLAWKGEMSREDAYKLMEQETGVTFEEARIFANSERVTSVAKRYIIGDPVRYGAFHFIRGIPFIFSSGLNIINEVNRGVLNHLLYEGEMPRIFINIERTLWLGVLALAVAALYFKPKDPRVYLFLAIVFYFWALTGPVAYVRYRLPAEPFLLILACVAALELYQSYKKRRI